MQGSLDYPEQTEMLIARSMLCTIFKQKVVYNTVDALICLGNLLFSGKITVKTADEKSGRWHVAPVGGFFMRNGSTIGVTPCLAISMPCTRFCVGRTVLCQDFLEHKKKFAVPFFATGGGIVFFRFTCILFHPLSEGVEGC